MATAAKRAPKAAPAETDANEDFQDYVDFQSLNPALEQIRADLNITGDGDVTCHVSKLDADSKGTEFKVWQGDPDEYNLEAIAKRFGSGQYRIMVYMKIPSGHKVRQINKVQALMLSPEDEARVVAARAAALNPPEPRQQDNSNALASVMVQGFQQLGELIVKATQKPEVDPMAQMTALAGVIKTIMPSAPAAPTDPLSGFASMLNMVKAFNDVTGAGKSNIPEGADSSTALMMAGMDMFKPIVQKALEQKAGQVQQPINGQPLPQIGAPIAPVAASDESEDFMLFKLQLKAANKMAAQGRDVADFADQIYPMLPDNILHGMALDPQWFAYLVKAVPECEQHQAWYSAVRNAIVDMAVEDGVFVRGADGSLTLAPDDAQNAAEPKGTDTNAAGTKPA